MLRLTQLNFNYFHMRYFVANWKMYAGPKHSLELATAYHDISIPEGVTAVVAPGALSFIEVQKKLAHTAWKMSAQNIAWVPEGAYTGAISAEMYQEAGAQYVLIGHSERRHIFGEGDHDVEKKVAAAVHAGLIPILCVGETAEDLAENKRQYRLKKQLQVLASLDTTAPLLVAYEPVWAIANSGTGTPCLPADVQDVHGFIQTELATFGFVDTPVIYGGSVKPENAAEYLAIPEVNGILAGSAAMHPESVQELLHILA